MCVLALGCFWPNANWDKLNKITERVRKEEMEHWNMLLRQ